ETFLVDDIVIQLVGAPPGAERFVNVPAIPGDDADLLDGATNLAFAATTAPNPVRSSGSLWLTTTRPGSARVSLFDASGRRVRTPLDASLLAAGRHEVCL